MSELVHEAAVLNAIHHKGRNQHKSQVWWHYFDIFNRRVSQLAKQKKPQGTIVKYLVNKLIPGFWRALHSSLAQGAFIGFTFAVMASVAKIYDLILPFAPRRTVLKAPAVASTEDLGEVIGDEGQAVVETAAETVALEPPVALKPPVASKPLANPAVRKPKKKKKKRDAIDDIFG